MLIMTDKKLQEQNSLLFEQVSVWRTKVEELDKRIQLYKEQAETAQRNAKYWSDQSSAHWIKFTEMEDKYLKLKRRRRKK